MARAKRDVMVKVTAKRLAVKFPGSKQPDCQFPSVAQRSGFPARYRGVYRVPEEEMIGGWISDGRPIWDQFDDWIAKGYKKTSD